ncbi:unnamed protein product, partial [Didymodactylos carnosus]
AQTFEGDVDTSTNNSGESPKPKKTSFTDSKTDSFQSSVLNLTNKLKSTARTVNKTDYPDELFSKLDLTSPDLFVEQEKQLRHVLHQYSDIFSSQTGRTNVFKHHIDVGNSKPIKRGPYRLLNPEKKTSYVKQTAEMFDGGICEPSFGPWGSPVTPVPKKDGTLRFCVDFRKLNEITVKDTYPIPRIDDTLDVLNGAKYFSTIDLSSGFLQVELDKESKEKTAFVTHEGIFQFNVMPFGLTNAPATFHRFMDLVLRGLKWNCCLVYLDDVIIYSATFEQHLEDIHSVLERIKINDLTLKPSKCFFARQELKYLGHIVSAQGIRPDPEKLEAVRSFPSPGTAKDVRAFLELTGYYRRFIKNYAEVAESLFTSIREKHNSIFAFTPECQQAFELLKQRLISAPIVAYPNFDYPFLLQLDACDHGLSAVLAQNIDGIEHVIAYASRTLQPCERNIKDPTSLLARWAIKFDAYDMIIKHRSGKYNANADSLSRYPLKSEKHCNVLDDIKLAQRQDKEYSALISFIHDIRADDGILCRKLENLAKIHKVVDGKLYRVKKFDEDPPLKNNLTPHLLVIPKSKRLEILKLAHDHPVLFSMINYSRSGIYIYLNGITSIVKAYSDLEAATGVSMINTNHRTLVTSVENLGTSDTNTPL